MSPSQSPAIEQLFGQPGVIAHLMTDDADPEELLDAERRLVCRAGPVRQRHFAAGRLCARAGLRVLGFEDRPILAGADRRPLWPTGAYGSISHTRGLAVAVVAATDSLGGRRFGVDAERRGRVHEGLYRHVFTGAERAVLGRLADPDRQATAIFSAKEAFYKAQFAFTGAWVGFGDVTMELDGVSGRAHPATDLAALKAVRWPVPVAVTSLQGIVVAGVTVETAQTT